VIQTKQHLAALVPVGPGLVLNLLRWGTDIRPWTELPLPSEDAKKAGLNEREIKMAEQLVEDMSADWDPDEYKDEFKDEILRLVDRKVAAGQTETVTQIEPEEGQAVEGRGAKIIDLTELLQRSLRKGGGAKASTRTADADEEEDDEDEPAKPSAKSRTTAKAKPKTKAHAKATAKSTSGSAAGKRSAAKTAPARRRAA
jgi:DNA end-binding protein Ku